MARDEVERVVRSAYAARKIGDLDAVMGHFADHAQFALAGSTAASPVPMSASGGAAIRTVMERLIASFEFHDVEMLDTIIDGDKAAVHWRVRVRATESGAEAVTEFVDILRVEGGRIVAFTQFADTALATSLLRGVGS